MPAFCKTVPGRLCGWPIPIQEPTQSCLIRKGIVIIQEIPKDLGALSGTRVKDQILEQNVLLVLLSLRKLQGFLQTLYQEMGTETKYIFSILSQKRLNQWQKEVENINTLP